MILVSQKGLRSSGNSKHSHRKLLSYSEKDVRKDRATSGRFGGANAQSAQSHKKEGKALAENEGTTADRQYSVYSHLSFNKIHDARFILRI